MKRIFTLIAFVFFGAITANAQLLSWSPTFIQESSTPVTITMDATLGNQGLLNYTPTNGVYVHIGVITNKSTSSSDWKYVPFTWGTTPTAANCTYLGNNKWSYTITGGLRTFFGITDATETIQKIAILFRSGDGNSVQRNADASDMFVPVYSSGLYARIDQPYRQPEYTPIPQPVTYHVGDAVAITANASQSGTLSVYFNGALVKSSIATTVTTSATVTTAGNQQIVASVNNGSTTASDTFNFVVSAPTTIAPLPAGADSDGVTYEKGDTSVILALYAPLKSHIFVVGDFNSWIPAEKYQMNETPDSLRYWIRITGLTPGTEYAYQYLIDDTIKVADYNTEKVLDPNVDQYISSTTYPNLKPYPTGLTTGIVSVLQTAKPAYNWQVTNFTRPDQHSLRIYELLIRDYTAAGNWQTLQDTLSYLKRLGVNAIEVMPFNNFEGVSSWGYNPNFYFAPDKVYGTETNVKQFVDACHAQGMAVIMDMVLNHSFGSSPMVQMYWDSKDGIPAANSPWFDQYYTHADDVGYQFNHEAPATKSFTQRVVNFWLTNYNIDGYRFDLAKGFTQTNTCDATGNNCNVDAWGVYDPTRVAIWDTIYNQQQRASPGSYCILEMFADNQEQTLEANYGMMIWGNENYAYNQATMGYAGSDFSGGYYSVSGWAQPNLVTYQESHDEERLMWKNEQYGNNSGTYKIMDTATGLKRNAMATAFWAMVPGPLMLYEFGELGYDYSINTCMDAVTVNDSCRTDPKPIKWNYLKDTGRAALFSVYQNLFRLRAQPAYASTFSTGGKITYNTANNFKWLGITSSALDIVVVGNFDVVAGTSTVLFPSTGTWYSYLTDTSITVTSTTPSITLKPGEYYVFTNIDLHQLALPVQWLSFTAQNEKNSDVLLNWSTTNEINNNYFDVQRSIDGVTYTTIGSVPAGTALGNIQTYQFNDASPNIGINYYRLKQVDKDGQVSYSKVVAINISGTGLWQVYPNPAHGSTTLHINSNLGKVQLTLTDALGKKVYQQAIESTAAGQQVTVPVQNLAKGIYLLQVSTGKNSQTEKIVVQ